MQRALKAVNKNCRGGGSSEARVASPPRRDALVRNPAKAAGFLATRASDRTLSIVGKGERDLQKTLGFWVVAGFHYLRLVLRHIEFVNHQQQVVSLFA